MQWWNAGEKPSVNNALDASAVVAMMTGEPGAAVVAQAMREGAVISAVNLAEVVTKLHNDGGDEEAIRADLDTLGLTVIPFDEELAFQTGLLRPSTRAPGLSLGDRACLALARRLGVPALTADRLWTTVDVGVTVQLIR